MITKNNNKRRTSEKEILVAELFEAISHPTRIRILKTLGNEVLGFAKLKSSLGFSSSGNLSHHLNKLGTLVQTNDQGNYELTDQGREALISIDVFGSLDKDWLRNANAIIMTFLFYSTWLTVGIIIGFAVDVLSTLLSGLAGSVVVYVIIKRKLHPDFQKKPIWPYKEKTIHGE